MNNPQPTISVGMPVYNGERYLELAIRSILDQTHADFELIISDNASTDGTEEICRNFVAQDSRIRYVRNNQNIGAARNYNQLFKLSTAKYFRWQNCDDLCSPQSHAEYLATLEARPDVVLCYGKTDIIDDAGGLIKHYDDRLDLQAESAAERFEKFLQIVGLSNELYGLMRRSALERTHLMGSGTYPAADITLGAALALQGKFVELPETLFYRRMHPQASSWDRDNQGVQERFWGGVNSGFLAPHIKSEYSLWTAIDAAPVGFLEKSRMRSYIVRRIIWNRQAIGKELMQLIARQFSLKADTAPS